MKDIVFELAQERKELSIKLEILNKTIKEYKNVVSEKREELWRKQLKTMQDYFLILGERIKDLIDNG